MCDCVSLSRTRFSATIPQDGRLYIYLYRLYRKHNLFVCVGVAV